MKKKTDNDMPIGKVTIIDDFLPSPKDLAEAEKTEKITIMLNKNSIDFFKKQAKKHNTKYQRMIRKLIEKYVNKYSASL